MPVDEKLMASLKTRYGDKRGEGVYYAMEAAGKGPFAPGGALHAQHLAFAEKHGLSPNTSGPSSSRKRGSSGRSRSTGGHGKAPSPSHKARRTGPPKR